MSSAEMLQQPTSEEIERHLCSILASRRFRDAPKLRAFLVFIVDACLKGGTDQLDVTNIAKTVFGKDKDFKSSSDSVVRVTLHRLREAVALYQATEGAMSDVVFDFEPGKYAPSIKYREVPLKVDFVRAMSASDAYQASLTESDHKRAERELCRFIEHDPENVEILAAYADVCLDGYKYGWTDHLLDEGCRAIDLAKTIDGNSSHVQFIAAMYALHSNDLAAVANLGQRLKHSHGNNPVASAQGSWMLAMTKDPVTDAENLQIDLPDNCDLPGWMHQPDFLAKYHTGNYEAALCAAIRFGMPDFYWGPMIRAAVLGQLDLLDAAGNEVSRMLCLNPSFCTEPRRHLGEYIRHSDALEHVLDGLYRAGLPRQTSTPI